MKKLFVSNIDFETTEAQLREMFEEIGSCASVVLALDRETRKSKGFAFVEMENDDNATAAITKFNNHMLNGRPMKVCEDRGRGGSNSQQSEGGSDSKEGGQKRPEPLPAMQRIALFKRRRKLDPFIADPSKTVDYKDVATLSKFVSERGRILSRRLTGLSAYNQRKVSKAIKRAQNLGIMPYSNI